jgi:hypothetical protein
MSDLKTRKETKGYVLLYCPHNRAGLIKSMEEGEEPGFDVVISPVDEKQLKGTVVSVLLGNVFRESSRMDQIFESCETGGKLGSA